MPSFLQGFFWGSPAMRRKRAAALTAFITNWDTTSSSEMITLPATSTSNNFTVDWGDGSAIETVTTASPTHIYVSIGNYNITIEGTCPAWSFSNTGDKLKIKDVSNWGIVGFTNLFSAFYGCSNMTTSASDAGDFSAVTNMYAMFQFASVANPDVSNWNVSSVKNMYNMFFFASLSNINYDLLLAAWSLQTLQSGVPFHAGGAKYTETAGRAVLTSSPNNWTITDGGAL